MTVQSTARGMVANGRRASTPSAAELSKPTNAVIASTAPVARSPRLTVPEKITAGLRKSHLMAAGCTASRATTSARISTTETDSTSIVTLVDSRMPRASTKKHSAPIATMQTGTTRPDAATSGTSISSRNER